MHRKQARHALSSWNSVPGRLLGAGENIVYAVQDQPWVLRIHRPDYHSRRGIESELDFMDAAHDAGLTVPHSVATPDGRRLVDCGESVATMITRLPGRVRTKPGVRSAEGLGHAIADLLRFASEWTPPPDFERLSWDLEGLLGAQASWGNLKSSGFDLALADEVTDALVSRLNGRMGALTLLHHDLHFGNVVWDGYRPGIIDFDDCGFGFPLVDVAIPLSRLTHREDLTTAFLRGYGTPVDRELLPAVYLLLMLRAVPWMKSRSDVPDLAVRFETFRPAAERRAREWLDSLPY